ncbi:hypothetical protein CRG98_001368 [Punica granatum]|uniref:Uncharacterized protein n=1 Tax=Punica granatum TaxID=22663 RepID=A0A2I0LBZ5_PUNGR|nr:hypothetical protein CRG98_001368 [Punica granatum]
MLSNSGFNTSFELTLERSTRGSSVAREQSSLWAVKLVAATKWRRSTESLLGWVLAAHGEARRVGGSPRLRDAGCSSKRKGSERWWSSVREPRKEQQSSWRQRKGRNRRIAAVAEAEGRRCRGGCNGRPRKGKKERMEKKGRERQVSWAQGKREREIERREERE